MLYRLLGYTTFTYTILGGKAEVEHSTRSRGVDIFLGFIETVEKKQKNLDAPSLQLNRETPFLAAVRSIPHTSGLAGCLVFTGQWS